MQHGGAYFRKDGRGMKKKKARMLAAAMLAGGALLNYGTASAADSDRDSAARAIAHSEMDVRSAAEKNATAMDTRNMCSLRT